MPALPDVASVLRIAISGAVSSQPWLTRLYMQYGGAAPTTAQLNTFNGSIATELGSYIKPLLDVDTTITQIETVDLTSSTSAVSITAESITGTRSGVVLPAETSVVISGKISRRYRGGHPRNYWPMGVQGDLANRRAWGSSFLSTVSTDYGDFIAGVVAAVWSGGVSLALVNVGYYKGFTNVDGPTGRARAKSVLNPDGPTVDLITSTIPQPSVGTQRRRIGFVD